MACNGTIPHHPSPAPEVKAETKLPAKVGRLCMWIRLGLDFLYQVAGKIRMSGAKWTAQNGHTRSPGASDWWTGHVARH